ncbi:MAG: PEP-CTERM sorting domain-containing protein [Phycisphaerales bacterium]
MTQLKIAAVAGAAVGMAAVASASVTPNTYEIRVSNVVSPSQPSTTVEVWADWDSDLFYAFAAAEWNLLGDMTGDFSGPASAFTDPGQDGGTPMDGNVMDIVTGQLQFPPGSLFADTSDPVLIWSATWSTSDFTARTVDLATDTTRYSLYVDDTGLSSDVTTTVLEGAGAIEVIPAPASLALLGLGGLAATRRRR